MSLLLSITSDVQNPQDYIFGINIQELYSMKLYLWRSNVDIHYLGDISSITSAYQTNTYPYIGSVQI